MNALTLTISNIAIRQDVDGRFNLNDLHKSAGGESKHQPGNWLRNQQTIDLIEFLKSEESKAGIPAIQSKQQLGTFVVKELVYAYAMWISPAFSLKVIRAYDSLVMSQPTPQTYQLQHLAALQAELLKSNPRLQDVLNLTRLGYSQARIGEMLGLGQNTIYRSAKRLRDCGFVVCADAARLPMQGISQ